MYHTYTHTSQISIADMNLDSFITYKHKSKNKIIQFSIGEVQSNAIKSNSITGVLIVSENHLFYVGALYIMNFSCQFILKLIESAIRFAMTMWPLVNFILLSPRPLWWMLPSEVSLENFPYLLNCYYFRYWKCSFSTIEENKLAVRNEMCSDHDWGPSPNGVCMCVDNVIQAAAHKRTQAEWRNSSSIRLRHNILIRIKKAKKRVLMHTLCGVAFSCFSFEFVFFLE